MICAMAGVFLAKETMPRGRKETLLGQIMENEKKYKVLRVLLPAVIIICLFSIGQAYYLSVKHEKQQEMIGELQRKQQRKQRAGKVIQEVSKEPEVIVLRENFVPAMAQKERLETKEPVILKKYRVIYEENHDLVGWLSIEDMVIDYPVMRGADDEYYLHRDFFGKEDRYGCLFVKSTADVDTPDTNFIIYGHNMRDGSMFGDLDLYQEESFYLAHPTISFDTLYEERTYEILAVFRSKVYNENEDVFKYYQFYTADTEEEFDNFYRNIKELSLYDTGVTAEFGDTFLTLSTCAYHVTDGRFAIVAKRVE